jgi:hypothetical protein
MTTTPPPGTDPLDAAIEAAIAVYETQWGAYQPAVAAAVRAAAPHIEAAALRRAADEIAKVVASHRPTNIQWSHMDFQDSIYDSGMEAAEKLVRARAEAVGTEADHG